MPIWSLTKERVEKLLKQVGDKELEIDELLKLTKEDLWMRDLDDFIAEWRFQLDDEAKRQKKVSNMTRRASTKLKIAGGGIAGRKRKGVDSDDSDFDMPKAKKTAVPKQPKPVGGLLSYMAPAPKPKAEPKAKAPSAVAKAAQRTLDLLAPTKKEPAEDDIWMSLDGSGDNRPKATKARTVAPLKQPAPKKQVDSDEEEIIRPKPSRQPRAAAAKPVKYNTLSDSDGDDMILDVATMVKGINTSSADNSRQLFSASASRPSSSSGLTKKPTSSKPAIDLDADDTNYSMLAPPTTTKGPAVIARKTILPDDDDDSLDSFDDIAPAPKVSKPKPAPKPKAPAKPPTKKATATTASKGPSLEPKQTILSPAAKAYAAKRAKQAALEADKDSEDELEKIADEIMDDEEEEAPAAAKRPGRRAAAAPKKWVISDDEEEDEGVTADFEEGDSDD